MKSNIVLLDADFISKTLLTNNEQTNLLEVVLKFENCTFFCHETVLDELLKQTDSPYTAWYKEILDIFEVKMVSDKDILEKLETLYGSYSIYIFLELLRNSCDSFSKNFFKNFYNSLDDSLLLSNKVKFLEILKDCDNKIPNKNGLGEKKTLLLIKILEIFSNYRVVVFCSDDYKARRDISISSEIISCISILGIFRKLFNEEYDKDSIINLYYSYSDIFKNQDYFKVWDSSLNNKIKVAKNQILIDLLNNKFNLLKNGELKYK